ncbi:hypothetical protein Tco_0261130 [Tanacetum coccineum]
MSDPEHSTLHTHLYLRTILFWGHQQSKYLFRRDHHHQIRPALRIQSSGNHLHLSMYLCSGACLPEFLPSPALRSTLEEDDEEIPRGGSIRTIRLTEDDEGESHLSPASLAADAYAADQDHILRISATARMSSEPRRQQLSSLEEVA